jgi:hypothetical protein
MKNIFRILIAFIPIGIIMAFNYYDQPSYDYVPVLMNRDDLKKSVFYKPAQELVNPGRIYYKDNYLFISDRYKGIHVIDNTDPVHPANVGFINIPGCLDIAIKDNILYSDNSIDMVAIDLTGFPDFKVTERLEGVFPEPLPPNSGSIPTTFLPQNRPKNTVIIGWEKVSGSVIN